MHRYMTRFTEAEWEAIRQARLAFPDLSQRTLARKIYLATGGMGYALRDRSRQSIYGAVRRLDAKLEQTVTAGIAAAESQYAHA